MANDTPSKLLRHSFWLKKPARQRVRHLEQMKAAAEDHLVELRRQHDPSDVADDIAVQQREIRYCRREIERLQKKLQHSPHR